MAGAGQASDTNTFGRCCVENRRYKFLTPLRLHKRGFFSGLGGNFSPPRPRIHVISSRPSSTFIGFARHEPGWPGVASMSRSNTYRRVSCFWSACWEFSTWKRKFRRLQQREQIVLEKQTFFSRVPHSGGTSVSSAGFCFEQFKKITLEHRVSIVTGLQRFFWFSFRWNCEIP